MDRRRIFLFHRQSRSQRKHALLLCTRHRFHHLPLHPCRYNLLRHAPPTLCQPKETLKIHQSHLTRQHKQNSTLPRLAQALQPQRSPASSLTPNPQLSLHRSLPPQAYHRPVPRRPHNNSSSSSLHRLRPPLLLAPRRRHQARQDNPLRPSTGRSHRFESGFVPSDWNDAPTSSIQRASTALC